MGSLDFVDMKRAADVVMIAACCCWACLLKEWAAAERAAMARYAAEYGERSMAIAVEEKYLGRYY